MKMFLSCALVLVASASPVFAQSVFTGTWKGDIAASQMSAKPSVILLSGGTYTCSTCRPVVSVAADGAFHPVVGNPYYDEMMVSIVDPMTVKRATRKAGKVMAESTLTIAAGGKTLTTTYNDMSADNGIPVTGSSVSERVAAAPAGAHLLSGSWRATNTGQVSDSGLIFTVEQTGKVIKYSTPTGNSYTATIGGPIAPVAGDPGWTSVSLKQTGPRTLVETDVHDGKTIAVLTMTVSADGKTMATKIDDIKFGKTSTLIATKQ